MDETRKNHVISRKKILEFLASHPEQSKAAGALDAWYRAARRSTWSHFGDVRATFGSADVVGRRVVFNVAGNNLRLIARINYKHNRVFILHVLTHAEYDEGRWKK